MAGTRSMSSLFDHGWVMTIPASFCDVSGNPKTGYLAAFPSEVKGHLAEIGISRFPVSEGRTRKTALRALDQAIRSISEQANRPVRIHL